MTMAAKLVEVWRGDILECNHTGHVAVCDAKGEIRESWGDPEAVILPRSSCKMIQALPLLESGAAASHGLTSEHLALACASHQGAPIHTDRVRRWLADLGLGDDDLRCGPEASRDIETEHAMIRKGIAPEQCHNNCSGKHTGFLTLTRHLGAGPEYVDLDHPVQKAVRAAFEDLTETSGLGHGIDGCSAPNFATSVRGLARAMARFASPDTSARGRAAGRLVEAMAAHPDLVAGEGRACTELMAATEGRVAVKTGAEGVFAAILPEQGLGVALKISDGATRASNAAMAAILVRLGVLSKEHPAVQRHACAEIRNRRGIPVGRIHTVI